MTALLIKSVLDIEGNEKAFYFQLPFVITSICYNHWGMDATQVTNSKYNHHQLLFIICFRYTKVNFILIYQCLKTVITFRNKNLTWHGWITKLCVIHWASRLLTVSSCYSLHHQSTYCSSPHPIVFVSSIIFLTFIHKIM